MVLASACVDLPAAPDVTAATQQFAAPTGSLKELLGQGLGGNVLAGKNAAAPIVAPTDQAADAVTDTAAGIELPVDGFVRVTYTCDEIGEGEPGYLRATMVIRRSILASTFAVEAKRCRNAVAGKNQVDGAFAIAMSDPNWVVASFVGSHTPLDEAGNPSGAAQDGSAALRFCRVAGPCAVGDLEISIPSGDATNVVLVFSASRTLAGVRDRDGLWSCEVDRANPQNSSCTLMANSVVVEGANQ